MLRRTKKTEVYDKIDVKMDQRRLKQREKKMREQIKAPWMGWDRLELSFRRTCRDVQVEVKHHLGAQIEDNRGESPQRGCLWKTYDISSYDII